MNHYYIIQLNRVSNIDDQQSSGYYMDHDSLLELVVKMTTGIFTELEFSKVD